MPTLNDLRSRFFSSTSNSEANDTKESMVIDIRGRLRPAQVVELKLGSALHGPTLLRAGLVTSTETRRSSK